MLLEVLSKMITITNELHFVSELYEHLVRGIAPELWEIGVPQ